MHHETLRYEMKRILKDLFLDFHDWIDALHLWTEVWLSVIGIETEKFHDGTGGGVFRERHVIIERKF